MAKKDLNKLDLAIEEAKKKVTSLENERKLVEENLHKQIGKLYVQIQLKKDKTLSYEAIQSHLKEELSRIKKEDKYHVKMDEKQSLKDHSFASEEH